MSRPEAELGIIQSNFDLVKERKNDEGRKGRTIIATVSAFKPTETLTVGPEENYGMATVDAFNLLSRDCEAGPACQRKGPEDHPRHS